MGRHRDSQVKSKALLTIACGDPCNSTHLDMETDRREPVPGPSHPDLAPSRKTMLPQTIAEVGLFSQNPPQHVEPNMRRSRFPSARCTSQAASTPIGDILSPFCWSMWCPNRHQNWATRSEGHQMQGQKEIR